MTVISMKPTRLRSAVISFLVLLLYEGALYGSKILSPEIEHFVLRHILVLVWTGFGLFGLAAPLLIGRDKDATKYWPLDFGLIVLLVHTVILVLDKLVNPVENVIDALLWFALFFSLPSYVAGISTFFLLCFCVGA